MSRTLDKDRVRKILVVRNDNLGDVICSTPALEALRRAFPEAYIAVLVTEPTRGALLGNPFIDKVYSYVKAKHSDAGRLRSWWDQWKVMSEIRGERFDLAIGMRAKFTSSNGWLVFASGAPLRLGRRPHKKGRWRAFFFNIYVEYELEDEHEVERSLNVVREIGVDIDEKKLLIPMPDEEIERAEKFVREQGLKKDGRPLVCIHLTARTQTKRTVWPVRSYVEVIDRLMDKGRADVVLNWIPRDEYIAAGVLRGVKLKPPVYIGAGVQGFAAFLSVCDILITIECGAMHIGAAAGTPTVALFGPTPVRGWAPFGVDSVALNKGIDVASIKPDGVIRACERLLERSGP